MSAPPEALTVPEVDAFLHERVRLRLLTFLSVLRRADFAYLLRQSGLSRGNLSVQMAKLAEAGLVEIDKTFVRNRPRTVYSMTPLGRSALGEYKREMSSLLDIIPD